MNDKKSEKVCVIGLGYVGFPLAVLCSLKGYNVYGYDKDESKLDRIEKKENIIGEKYLDDLLPKTNINIIRDVKKDFNSGRIYIPSEDMEKFGYSAEDLKIFNYNNSFRNLMKYECERAREYYSLAWKFLPAEDRKNMTAALIMERIYYLLLQKIEKRKYNIFGDPVRISSLRKFIAASSVFMKHKIF